MATRSRGAFIVFEGLDRAGKTTQCEKLVQSLLDADHPVTHMRFPNRSTPIGGMIDTYLKGETDQEDHVIHLLFAANRWEAAAKIESHLAAGTTVVVDRYYYSGAVYSAAKEHPNLSLQWARKPDEGLPRPDICIFLDISAEAAAQRGNFGTEKYEKKEMQARVRQLFETLRNSPEGEDIVLVDGGRSLAEVEAAVSETAQRTIQDVISNQRPLRRMHPWPS